MYNNYFYDLDARFDKRKSFYGKAKTQHKNEETAILTSYGTTVCIIYKDNIYLNQHDFDTSQTTMRHIKEFLKQEKDMFMDSKEIKKAFNNGTFKSFYDIPKDKTMELLGV